MKKVQNLLFFALLLSIAAVACHKHEDDTNKPVISLVSPVANASISGAVAIAGVVTDESLHELTITVTKDSDNSELFKATPEVHDLTNYTINEVWTPAAVAAETAVTLTITTEDHDANSATTTVKFKLKP